MRTLRGIPQLCALVILLLAKPAMVRAQLTFITNNDNTITITGYTGSNGVVVIPSTTNGCPVTGIGDNAFIGAISTNILLPTSVTSIGVDAFAGCFNLVCITIPDNLTNIGAAAFNSCHGLTTVAIPASVTSIGDYAFVYCTNLAAIIVDPANPAYKSADGVLFNKDQTILMQFPSGKSGSYSIPSSVTNLADEAFGINDYGQYPFPYSACAGLTNVIIPGSIVNIPDQAFSHCSGLISVTLSNGITSIGTNAFSWCPSLTDITFPSSVTSIGDTAFYYSGLVNVTVPGNITNFGAGVFAVCSSLTNVIIQDGVPIIGEAEFNFCTALTSVTIAESMTSIGDTAFWFCSSLTNETIPENTTNIGQHAFSGCTSLMSIEVSTSNPYYSSVDGVLYDKEMTTLIQFPGGKGGSYIVPIGVTNISDDAFDTYDPNGAFLNYYSPPCVNLTNITISATVTSAGSFDELFNLTSIHCEGQVPENWAPLPLLPNPNAAFFFLPEVVGTNVYPPITELWLPELQTVGNGPAMQTNHFGFNINWARGQTVVVESCTNLFTPNWQPVQTNTLETGSDYFSDSQWTNYPGRFYRIRSPE